MGDTSERYNKKRELSRKRSIKSSTKELQDLTNLIRKTKNSPYIKNNNQQEGTTKSRNLQNFRMIESRTY